MKPFGLLILALSLVSVRAADLTPLPPLNASASGQSLPGKAIWADLYTTNAAASIAFYTGLFGWKEVGVRRPGGVYTILYNTDGRAVAGVVSRPAAKDDTGKGRWITYLSVANLDQALASVQANGGKIVHPAKYLAQRGSQALIADSQGSLVGLIQSSSGDPEDAEPTVGAWAWLHLSAHDAVAASQFYHTVLGFEAVADNRDNRQNVFLLNSQGMTRAALGPIPARPDAQTEWLGFIRVTNLDDAVARATKLGGRVLLEPKSTRPETRLAVIADSNDVAIGLVELYEGDALQKQNP